MKVLFGSTWAFRLVQEEQKYFRSFNVVRNSLFSSDVQIGIEKKIESPWRSLSLNYKLTLGF